MAVIQSASLIGQTYGRWTIVGAEAPSRRRFVLVACACGTTRTVLLASLRGGISTSCGCVPTRHGHYRTKLYQIWTSIKARCFNPKQKAFRHYGGRGIGLWVAWCALYECFEQDVIAAIGPHPGKGWSIDRIDNDGHYEPGNVRWATASEQARNKRPRQPGGGR